jgi:hypothetical protein
MRNANRTAEEIQDETAAALAILEDNVDPIDDSEEDCYPLTDAQIDHLATILFLDRLDQTRHCDDCGKEIPFVVGETACEACAHPTGGIVEPETTESTVAA